MRRGMDQRYHTTHRMTDQHVVTQIELFHERVNVVAEGLPGVSVRVRPRAISVSAQIHCKNVMVRHQTGSDEVKPMRMCRPAVDAKHRPLSGGAVIKVVEFDAVGFDKTAGAGSAV